MKRWRQAVGDSLSPGVVATIVTCLMVAWRGRQESTSAIAPINASSHVLWGDDAAKVETYTAKHTLPGLLVNLGGGMWWALVFEKLFGAEADRRGPPAALLGSALTSVLAYVVDYRLVPRRLTPGWEHRVSERSVFMSLGAMAGGLAVGALLQRKFLFGNSCRRLARFTG